MALLDEHLLGIDLPKNSEPFPEFGRDGRRDMKSWPNIPSGTIGAGQPLAKNNPFSALSVEECIDMVNILRIDEKNWSRRDRRRHDEIMDKIDRDELSRAQGVNLSPDVQHFQWASY
jgi:hypothetical protein